MPHIFSLLAALVFAGWVLTALRSLRAWRAIQPLPAVTGALPGDDPFLSVIIPFRDEAGTLEETVARLLREPMPIEILLIDDQSADASHGIAEDLAHHARVRTLRLETLPANWLGKPYACHRGAELARGHYLLFMDADVAVEADVLRRVVGFLARHEPAHLVLFPRMRTEGFLESAYITLFVFLFLFRFDPRAAEQAGRSGHVGVGAFNLVRRDVYDRIGGHARLRLAIADDVMLGKRVKQAGEATAVFHAGDGVRVRWRRGFADTLRATRRSVFAGTGFSLAWLLVAVSGTLLGMAGPFLFLAFGDPITRVLGVSSVLVMYALLLWQSRRTAQPALPVSLFPLMAFVFLGSYCASAWDALRRRRLTWRGRAIDARVLRRWQRDHG